MGRRDQDQCSTTLRLTLTTAAPKGGASSRTHIVYLIPRPLAPNMVIEVLPWAWCHTHTPPIVGLPCSLTTPTTIIVRRRVGGAAATLFMCPCKNTPQDLNRMLQDLVGYVPKSCEILQLAKSHKNLDKILSRCNKVFQIPVRLCMILLRSRQDSCQDLAGNFY